MPYLYETHLHTKEGSVCGVSGGRDYIQRYLDLGYTGIIITDHFFRGNCRPDRNLPWEKWVSEFCQGYENARDEGARRGLDVFFGWEETIDGNDYLVYGLDREWLLLHPEAVSFTLEEQFEAVNSGGGCVVHAHPFRYSLRSIPHSKNILVNAVEAANSGNNQISDALAWVHAKNLKLPITAGSDIHYAKDIHPSIVFGVYLEKRMESIADYVNAIINNTITGLSIPKNRFA